MSTRGVYQGLASHLILPGDRVQFFFRGEVIPIEDVHGLMTANRHDSKIVIPDKSEVVEGGVRGWWEKISLDMGCWPFDNVTDYIILRLAANSLV
jgi:hypothetical protein